MSLEPFENDESVYFDASEDLCQSLVDKGKAPMFISSHTISEFVSSSKVKPPNILKALLPLPQNNSDKEVMSNNHPMKVLIGTREIEIHNPNELPGSFAKPSLGRPPHQCFEKRVIHEFLIQKDLQPGDLMKFWVDESLYHNHRLPPSWVGHFVIDLLWGSLGFFISDLSHSHFSMVVEHMHVRHYHPYPP